jgi:hypothetical protein
MHNLVPSPGELASQGVNDDLDTAEVRQGIVAEKEDSGHGNGTFAHPRFERKSGG